MARRTSSDNNILRRRSGFREPLRSEDAAETDAVGSAPFAQAAKAGPGLGRESLGAIHSDSSPAVRMAEVAATTIGQSAGRQSTMTLAAFVQNFFVPEHVARKSLSGRIHYKAILKHVLTPEEVDRIFQVDAATSKTKLQAVGNWPYMGHVQLCDVRSPDVQGLVAAAAMHGYSSQTIKHIRNVVSAIFAHARKQPWFHGDNPALQVTLPEMTRKEAHTLTPAQARAVLQVMQYPEKEMTLLAIFTGMNVAEICGLQWKLVNLTQEWSQTDGIAIPPRTIAVRQQWYRGELCNLAQNKRKRHLLIAEPLLSTLRRLQDRPNFTGPDDFVLASRKGTPVDEQNIRVRRLKLIAKVVQMPSLSWQVLLRSHATLANEVAMQFSELKNEPTASASLSQ